MARLWFVGVVGLGFALGCGGDVTSLLPTRAAYDARIQGYVGRSVNDAIGELGAPTRTVDGADGHRFYVWERSSAFSTPVVGEQFRNERGNQQLVVTGGEEVEFECVTELQTDRAGVVVSTRTEGELCHDLAGATQAATEPSAPPLTTGAETGKDPSTTTVAAPAPATPTVTAASAAPAEPAAASIGGHTSRIEEEGASDAEEDDRTPRRARRARRTRERE